jgi:hypothetical protein
VSQFGALGWKVGAGEEKGDGVLGGSIFSNWRRERGGWGSAWRSQVEEKMKGGHELQRRGRGSSDRQRRATGGGGGQSGDAARTGEMEGGGSGLVGRSERNSDIL